MTIGGSSGPVFGTLLVTLGKELPAAAEPAPTSRAALAAAIAALDTLGKAEVGQKTLLDVLDPVQTRAARAGGDRPRRAACGNARSTAPPPPPRWTRSRAARRFLGERALGHIDPGSRSMALIIGAICDSDSDLIPARKPP